MNKIREFVIAVFGASGDLASRKLFPAIFNLFKKNMIEKFCILALSRDEANDEYYRNKIQHLLSDGALSSDEKTRIAEFCSKIFFLRFNPQTDSDYKVLGSRLNELFSANNIKNNCLFYLSTPPSVYLTILNSIARHKLQKETGENWRRVIIEKPFGEDLESARALEDTIQDNYNENQIYRIDHYLGKESVQNVLAFRFSNEIFEPLWNRNYISYVEITAVEDMGILDRGSYYDKAGALRDMVQNHLLQVLGLVAMEPPAKFNSEMFRNEVLKVIESLRPLSPIMIRDNIIRGQYTSAFTSKGEFASYRSENNVAEGSKTETYVAMKLFIDNWRWNGVPFYIRTGKAMPTKVSEIVIHFKTSPYQIFEKESQKENRLVIRLLPDEGFLLEFGIKIPGEKFKVKSVAMDFRYEDMIENELPEAYERLILDCIEGDPMLFSRADIVKSSWSFIEPVLNMWKSDSDIPLYGYPAGTWGPIEAESLMSQGRSWVNPCKNLTNSEHYCLL